MKKSQILAALTVVTLSINGLQAASLLLWNTGVNGAGTKITTGGTADPHWTVASGSLTGGGSPAVVLNNQNVGIYIQNPGSAWIYETALGFGSSISTFGLEFDLTGFNPSSAFITGAFAVDNLATIYLNGQNIGIGSGELSYLVSNSGAFSRWHNFTLNNGFQPGINRLDVVVQNVSAGGGLNLTLEGTADAVPEPTSSVLSLTSLGLLFLRRRR